MQLIPIPFENLLEIVCDLLEQYFSWLPLLDRNISMLVSHSQWPVLHLPCNNEITSMDNTDITSKDNRKITSIDNSEIKFLYFLFFCAEL